MRTPPTTVEGRPEIFKRRPDMKVLDCRTGQSLAVCTFCGKPKSEGDYVDPRRRRGWVCHECTDSVLQETLAMNQELFEKEPDTEWSYWPIFFTQCITARLDREMAAGITAMRPKRPRLVASR